MTIFEKFEKDVDEWKKGTNKIIFIRPKNKDFYISLHCIYLRGKRKPYLSPNLVFEGENKPHFSEFSTIDEAKRHVIKEWAEYIKQNFI